MSAIPRSPAYFTIRPDWVCEVLSPSTERIDRGAKSPLRRAGVSQAWLVNPLQHTLEVLRLSAETPGQWTSLASSAMRPRAREPFDAIELELRRSGRTSSRSARREVASRKACPHPALSRGGPQERVTR